jgi:hypothetical protein
MLADPTVTQSSAIATLACKKLGPYSMISTPSRSKGS